MTRQALTIEMAHAAGEDAANRNMRAANRKVWNEEDYNIAVEEFDRLLPFLPAEDRFKLTGRK
jgi:hypothetical protein